MTRFMEYAHSSLDIIMSRINPNILKTLVIQIGLIISIKHFRCIMLLRKLIDRRRLDTLNMLVQTIAVNSKIIAVSYGHLVHNGVKRRSYVMDTWFIRV